VIHLRSFEAVSGPKRDKWLVKTVGLMIASVGATLLVGARSPLQPAVITAGTTAPALLAAIDLVYTGKKVIPKVYLLDALVELALIAAWGTLLTRRAREQGASWHRLRS
jgi:hypothetical protein